MTTDNAPFDTVKDLQDFLATFPPDTPVVAHYTGEGRVSGVTTFDDVTPHPACVAIFRTSEPWLDGHGLPHHNPRLADDPLLADNHT